MFSDGTDGPSTYPGCVSIILFYWRSRLLIPPNFNTTFDRPNESPTGQLPQEALPVLHAESLAIHVSCQEIAPPNSEARLMRTRYTGRSPHPVQVHCMKQVFDGEDSGGRLSGDLVPTRRFGGVNWWGSIFSDWKIHCGEEFDSLRKGSHGHSYRAGKKSY